MTRRRVGCDCCIPSGARHDGDAADRLRLPRTTGGVERSETSHGPVALFDGMMILLNEIGEVAVCTMQHLLAELVSDRPGI